MDIEMELQTRVEIQIDRGEEVRDTGTEWRRRAYVDLKALSKTMLICASAGGTQTHKRPMQSNFSIGLIDVSR